MNKSEARFWFILVGHVARFLAKRGIYSKLNKKKCNSKENRENARKNRSNQRQETEEGDMKGGDRRGLGGEKHRGEARRSQTWTWLHFSPDIQPSVRLWSGLFPPPHFSFLSDKHAQYIRRIITCKSRQRDASGIGNVGTKFLWISALGAIIIYICRSIFGSSPPPTAFNWDESKSTEDWLLIAKWMEGGRESQIQCCL